MRRLDLSRLALTGLVLTFCLVVAGCGGGGGTLAAGGDLLGLGPAASRAAASAYQVVPLQPLVAGARHAGMDLAVSNGDDLPCGWSSDATDTPQAVAWDANGVARTLGTVSGIQRDSYAHSVNSRGDLAGFGWAKTKTGWQDRAVFWPAGDRGFVAEPVRDEKLLNGTHFFYHVNDNGDMSGDGAYAKSGKTTRYGSWVRLANGQYLSWDHNLWPMDLANGLILAGNGSRWGTFAATYSGTTSRTYTGADYTRHELTVLDGTIEGGHTINNQGDVAGMLIDAGSGTGRATLWRADGPTTLVWTTQSLHEDQGATPWAGHSDATGYAVVAGTDVVVGDTKPLGSLVEDNTPWGDPFVWDAASGLRRLQDLVNDPSYTLTRAVAVNANGSILCWALQDGQEVSILLKPSA